MQCNIDSRGKAVRLISGFFVIALGLIELKIFGSIWVMLVLVACGAFMVFEGWAGWCIVRQMGFKTRL